MHCARRAVKRLRTFVAGHRGMVGSALLRRLAQRNDIEIITRERAALDLLDAAAVRAFFGEAAIDQVYLAAARVGGIHANNTYPADFIQQNLAIALNIIEAAHRADVTQLLFLASSSVYPREAEQPMREDALLTGPLEATHEPYSVAKIAGIKLCESYNRQHGRNYRSVVPTNLYGPSDNFHPENSHVVPALIRRFQEAVEAEAEEVVIWGSGGPMREFLHVDDMAAACVHIMELPPEQYAAVIQPMCSHINVGTGRDCTIRKLAETIAGVTGFRGALRFDPSKPDGAPRKLLDVSRLHALGWRASIGLEDGLRDAHWWFLRHRADFRAG